MSHHDSNPTPFPQVRLTAVGCGRELQLLTGERGVVPIPGAPLDTSLTYECGECPSTGPIANAEYMIKYTGSDPLNLGCDDRREFACRAHLADLIDYAATASTGFTPVLVAPIREAIAA